MGRTRTQPVRWTPSDDPGLTGPFERNSALCGFEVVDVTGPGPEDVAVHPSGDVYCGIEDGRIMRLPAGGGNAVTLCQTGGRVGGIEVAPDGDALYACDYGRGLLRVSLPDGAVEVLVTEVAGEQLRTTNNCSVGPDGRVWFSSSSRRWDITDFRADLLEGRATGRLLVHDPADGSTEVVLEGLAFANGVAVTADGSAVLVANTGSHDIVRYWLAGPRAGSHDVFVEGLPCLLDNLSVGADGRIWAACPFPRNKLLDVLSPRAPLVRRVAGALPEWLIPNGPEVVWVLAFDPDTGEVLENLQCWGGGYGFVTGVREQGDTLWLSSLTGAGLVRFRRR